MQPMGSHAAHVFLTPILNPISRLNSHLRSHFAVLSSAGRRIWTLGFGVEFRQDASKLRNRIQLGVNKRFQSPTVFPNHTPQFPVRSWSLRTRVPPNNGEEKKNGSKKKKIRTLAQEAVALKAKPAGSGQNLFDTLWTRKNSTSWAKQKNQGQRVGLARSRAI